MIRSANTTLKTVLATTTLACSTASFASMGNIGTTYGVMPLDVASAQGLSMFNSQVSATYYNPAALTKDPRGELAAGVLHAEHELKAVSKGGPAAPIRDGDVLQDAPSQHVLIGMKTNIGSLTILGIPVYLGFVAGVEKYGKEMLAFESETSPEGQFLEYGRQPLFLNLGGAAKVWRGISAGYAARITLHADASLQARTDLAGNTKYETLSVNAKPSIRSIFGVNMDLGETFCPESDCWFNGVEAALSYRASSNTKTSVHANTIIPGTIPEPGLNLNVVTLDSYQPEILSVGLQYSREKYRVALTLEQQNWSDLSQQFEKDTLKDQANIKFDDILIPRIGAQYFLNDNLSLIGGVSFEKSPLKSDTSLDVNYFDNDRIVVGLGLSATFNHTGIMAYPVQLDIGYQRHMLKERDFDLTHGRQNSGNVYETVSAEGSVDVLSAALTLKF